MASSIGDWYSNRADPRDGVGEDEHVERQAAWDLRRVDRLVSARRTTPSKRQTQKSPSTVLLTPEERRLKPLVHAMRRRHPGASYVRLSELLREEGAWVSRKQISRILAPVKPRAAKAESHRAEDRSGSGRQRASGGAASVRAESDRIGKLVAEAERAAKKILAADKRAKAAAETARRDAVKAATKGQKQPKARAAAKSRSVGQKAPSPAVVTPIASRAPRTLAPVRLVMDEPRRRRVKTTGWTRAKNVDAPMVGVRDSSDIPVPCYACGAVPSQFGSCRCT